MRATGPASVLAWTPPSTDNDNVVLDPERDLDYYEIYVRHDENFTDSDLPVIQVAAVAGALSPDGLSVVRSLVTEFTLELIPSLPAGSQLYVSMRAVGVDQQKSAFMAPLLWVGILAALATPAFAETLTISWDPVTTYTDKTPRSPVK